MNNIFRFILLSTLCLALTACYETFPPIKTTNVTHWQAGKPLGVAQALTPQQVDKLSAWLQNHRWGWQAVTATYAPAISLAVEHVDGTTSTANLMQKVIVVNQHQRSLSEAESQELHTIIAPSANQH
jgi:hypothetical protein